MSLTDRSKIYRTINLTDTTEELATALSSFKRKGISLSKQHQKQIRKQSPSFIKLYGKNRNSFVVEKREIKLLVKGKQEKGNQIKWEKQQKQNKIDQSNTKQKHLQFIANEKQQKSIVLKRSSQNQSISIQNGASLKRTSDKEKNSIKIQSYGSFFRGEKSKQNNLKLL